MINYEFDFWHNYSVNVHRSEFFLFFLFFFAYVQFIKPFRQRVIDSKFQAMFFYGLWKKTHYVFFWTYFQRIPLRAFWLKQCEAVFIFRCDDNVSEIYNFKMTIGTACRRDCEVSVNVSALWYS